MQRCLQSKQVNASVLYTPILILSDLHLFWPWSSTSSNCEAGTYRKFLAMQGHILNRNYGEIRQCLSKYLLCLGVSKSNYFGLFATVWIWLELSWHAHLENRKLWSILCFPWEFVLTTWIGREPCGNQRQQSTAPTRGKLKQDKKL